MAGGSKGLSHQRLKEDRISQLPDPLLTQILNHLPTEEAVRSSILSSRWRTLWLWVPNLEFSFSKFPSFNAFVSFGNWFFDSDRVSCIDSLKLSIDGNDASYSYLTSWIDALVKRKIQHLYVYRTRGAYPHEMPLSLYICESLVSLRLYRLTLVDAEFVSLPCLKILRLEDIEFHNEATFERLVSSCPVLEDLKVDVVSNDRNVYRVHSRSLKRFCFRRTPFTRFETVPGVVIDAPLLCCLRIDDCLSQSFIVTDLESNAKLDISLRFHLWAGFDEAKRCMIHMFLAWISRV
ncbi:unnamed protein product [Arabidopsis halleri]